jgi:DNA polymerase alpha-associated DNA helicase A
MHTKIADFPSRAMYNSELITHSSVAAHLLSHLPNITKTPEEDDQDILGTPVVFFDTAGCEYFENLEGEGDEGSRSNENEATIVKNWVATLVRCSVQLSLLALNQERLQLVSHRHKLE